MAFTPGTQNIAQAVWSLYAAAPPAVRINSISGSLTDGSIMTLRTVGAGTGADLTNKSRFDDFSNFVAVGEFLDSVENMFDTPSSLIKSVADSRSGSYAIECYNTSGGGNYAGSINRITLPDNPTEIYLTYAVKNPTGKKMPNVDTATPVNTFADGSRCKLAWPIGADSGTNDMVCPTIVDNQISITGNDLLNLDVAVGGADPEWWRFGEWIRISVWLRADKDNPSTVDGDYYFQALNPTTGMFENFTPSRGDKKIFQGGQVPYQFEQFDIPGWMVPNTIAANDTADQISMLYDDIGLVWGVGAAARIEIGENPVYNLCKKLTFCDSITRFDEQTVFTLRQGPLDFGASVYLFETKSDNTQLPVRQIL